MVPWETALEVKVFQAQDVWLPALVFVAVAVTSPALYAAGAAPPVDDDASAIEPASAVGDGVEGALSSESAAAQSGGNDRAAAAVEVDEGPEELAQRLFREGEEAYWLGDFERAVERFEEAYKLSKLPGMLYNVGLAYQRRYETSKEPSDLQRARAVFVNYLDADTGALIDPRHVEGVIAEIDAKLAVVEVREVERDAPEEDEISTAVDTAASCPDPALSVGPAVDTGRRPRLIGAGLMGFGGLLLSGGAVSLTVFSLKGREFEAVLAGIEGEQLAAGCGSTTSALCDDLGRSAEITVNNG